MIRMVYKTLQEFSFICYGKIKGFVLFSASTRRKFEVASRHFESKRNIFFTLSSEVVNFYK